MDSFLCEGGGGEGGLLFNYSAEERGERQEHQTLFEELLQEEGRGSPGSCDQGQSHLSSTKFHNSASWQRRSTGGSVLYGSQMQTKLQSSLYLLSLLFFSKNFIISLPRGFFFQTALENLEADCLDHNLIAFPKSNY